MNFLGLTREVGGLSRELEEEEEEVGVGYDFPSRG